MMITIRYNTHQESGDIFAFPPWRLHGVDPVKEEGVDRLIKLRSYNRPEDKYSIFSEGRSGVYGDIMIKECPVCNHVG